MGDLRVEVTDLTTGQRESKELRAGDYVIIAVAPCESEVVSTSDDDSTHYLRVSGRVPRAGSDLWRPPR